MRAVGKRATRQAFPPSARSPATAGGRLSAIGTYSRLFLPGLRLRCPTAGQDREHGAALERGLALYHGDVGHTRRDGCDLGPGHFRMRGFAAAEAHLNFDFVAFFEKAPCRANTDLQIVLVGARAQADLLDL